MRFVVFGLHLAFCASRFLSSASRLMYFKITSGVSPQRTQSFLSLESFPVNPEDDRPENVRILNWESLRVLECLRSLILVFVPHEYLLAIGASILQQVLATYLLTFFRILTVDCYWTKRSEYQEFDNNT